MGLQRDFDEILQEKLGGSKKKTTEKVAFQSQKQSFPEWKYQFTAPKITFTPQAIPPSYPRPTAKKIPFQPQAAKAVVQEPVYKIGEIGLEYTTDLITLQNLGADLDPAKISSTRLKKEYRKLAMRWHPDRATGDDSGKNFHNACLAYRNLSQALATLSK